MPPFRYTTAVRFADVDHAGIVYYPVFFHYFHVAFEEFFRAHMGARAYVELIDVQRIGFPSVSASCDFKAPLSFGDTIDIEMAVARLGSRSIHLGFEVYRQEHGDRPDAADTPDVQDAPDAPAPRGPSGDDPARPTRVLAARGTNVCAVVDLETFRAVPIPDFLRELLRPLG